MQRKSSQLNVKLTHAHLRKESQVRALDWITSCTVQGLLLSCFL